MVQRSLLAYSLKTAWLSIGSSLAGWKSSETRITTIARGSATAPILMVTASSPPTCRSVDSRASNTFSFPRSLGPKPHYVTSALLWTTIRAQPQRDVGRLYRLPYRSYQVASQGVEVRLIPDLGREHLKRLPRVVLPAVEASIYERLDATAHRIEQGRDHEGGDDYGELGLLLLASECPEGLLKRVTPPR